MKCLAPWEGHKIKKKMVITLTASHLGYFIIHRLKVKTCHDQFVYQI